MELESTLGARTQYSTINQRATLFQSCLGDKSFEFEWCVPKTGLQSLRGYYNNQPFIENRFWQAARDTVSISNTPTLVRTREALFATTGRG